MKVDQIPKHTNCRNCGACCGVIPVSREELNVIRAHIKDDGFAQRHAAAHSHGMTCPFRDELMHRCLIYSVRPLICRLFGVTSGMECEYGNSAQIDGRPFLRASHSLRDTFFLNEQDW